MCRSLPWALLNQQEKEAIPQQPGMNASQQTASLARTTLPTQHQAKSLYLSPSHHDVGNASDDDSACQVFQLTSEGQSNMSFLVTVNGVTINILADTGASVTLFDWPTFPKLTKSNINQSIYLWLVDTTCAPGRDGHYIRGERSQGVRNSAYYKRKRG